MYNFIKQLKFSNFLFALTPILGFLAGNFMLQKSFIKIKIQKTFLKKKIHSPDSKKSLKMYTSSVLDFELAEKQLFKELSKD